ncbi:MAG: prepilin-type N-terminal cleavage/methylation domain-containing protein, partial [Candidatus Omnitrophica bacterium]|nr:prepilin-type N-terminal cleavage/methylation domain-containing protein [Candidatus Omnitrophota bacterium]
MRIRKTFTLIGVLITVVILAILVTIGSPLYLNA